MTKTALLLSFLVACGEEAPDVGRIDVSHSAALLTHVGDEITLAANAFDPEGQPLTDSITWTSSRPDIVAIAADGTITARAAVGSAQITATLGDAVSPPVLVVVAEPVPGAILVNDSDVLADVEPVDPAAPFDLGFRVRFTVASGVVVAPGDLVLARESAAIAGRVVSIEPAPVGTNVVFETVAMPALFRKIHVEDSYRIDEAALAAAVDQAKPRVAELDENEFMWGPLRCKKPRPSFGAVSGDASLRIEPNLTLARSVQHDADGQITSMAAVMTGSITLTGTATVKFQRSLSIKFACDYKVTSIPIPVGGPMAMLVGLQVPIGIKGEIGGGLQAAELEVGFQVRATSHTTIGFSYNQTSGMTPIALMTQDVDIKPIATFNDAGAQTVAIASLVIGPTAGLDIGVFRLASFSLLEAWLQLRTDWKLSFPLVQLAEPTNASKYESKVAIRVGPGRDAASALSFLGGLISINPAVTLEVPVARSPTGTLVPESKQVELGQTTTLTVKFDPDTIDFITVRNLDEVRIYHLGPEQTEPEVIATLAASPETTWEWHPTITDVGKHVFWATVSTVLPPRVPLEITDDSHVEIEVTHDAGRWHGTINWQAAGDEILDSGPQFEIHDTLSASGSSTVKQNFVTPEFLDEQSATGNLEHVDIVKFTPTGPFDPTKCIYSTVTTTTTSGNTLEARNEPAAQLSVNEQVGFYTLYFQPATFAATLHKEEVASLVSGPDTCEPSSTTVSDTTTTFLPEDMIVTGTFTPGSNTITGSVTIETGLSPVASYTMSFTLTR